MSSPKKKESESLMTAVSRNLHDFSIFLYDSENKTVLGRTANNWGQILIFYAFYYSFLAALFAIAISIVLGSLDPYTPRFQTRIQTPGLSLQPRETSKIALTTDIKFTANQPGSYGRYVELLDNFIDGYGNQWNTDLYENCTRTNALIHQDFNDDRIVKACTFYPRDVLGACAVRPYGYDMGQPCLLIKVNRIIKWYPIGFNDLSQAKGNEFSKAPPLSEVLSVRGVQYNPKLMYISCYGVSEKDQRNLNGETGVSRYTTYYPTQNGISFKYYPYYGNKRQPQYKSPVVAVQFLNVTRNVEINVACKAYARNIVDDERMQVGYFKFLLQVN